MAEYDLVVIGAGPAGMAAARACAEQGLNVAVIDEQQRPGGQILRQPPKAFRVKRWLPGRGYHDLKTELAAFEQAAGITWFGGRSALGVARGRDDFVVQAAGRADIVRLTGRYILVAAGCYDLPVPLPGWTVPGVLAAGGVQAFIKSQQMVPGERFVMAGTHPLMLIIAAQIVSAGGKVAMVAFDQPILRLLRLTVLGGGAVVRNLGVFATAFGAMLTLRRHRVPVRFGLPLSSISGRDGVTSASLGAAHVDCDRVALCYGFVPQSDLPRMAGAAMEWADPAGGWRTRHDDWMETNVPGLFVAGETAGVAGADVALAEGSLAALGILRATGMPVNNRQLASTRARLHRLRGFTRLLAAIADPRQALARANPHDTILCRCEDVTYGEIAIALQEAQTPNAIKLISRCGMGLCQGRSCESALLREIARHSGRAVSAIDGFAARFPVRPARIGDLAEPASVATAATNLPAKGD